MASALFHFDCFQRIWKPQVFHWIGTTGLLNGYWVLDTGYWILEQGIGLILADLNYSVDVFNSITVPNQFENAVLYKIF